MQHIEFFNADHFENNYHRVPPPDALSQFIDFFWETNFDPLWKEHPKGFSDAQFPNIGYTYIINLGTPFVMQVDEKKFNVKADCFLPRYNAIECFHKPGNHLFGIKFRISPVVFEKKVNFSEYKEYLYPLSYLLDEKIIDRVKKVKSFEDRITILTRYFLTVLSKNKGYTKQADIVSKLLDRCFQKNNFSLPLEKEAERHKVSLRTLQRYFENCTGISTKQALQIMRIRKAVAHITLSPEDFDYTLYGYYDYSHFYKHIKQFLQQNTFRNMNPHLEMLRSFRNNR